MEFGYFTALKNGEPLPIKKRSERISLSSWAVLTPELLKVLHTNVGGRLTIVSEELLHMWKRLDLPVDLFDSIMNVGCLADEIEWLKFLALACSVLGVTIAETLKIATEIVSSDHECGPPRIPFSAFQFLYTFLADVDGEVSGRKYTACCHSSNKRRNLGPDGLIKVSDFLNNPKVRLE